MTRDEFEQWLLTKGWNYTKDKNIMTKDTDPSERWTLRYDGARFQKYSAVNGWRSLYFKTYQALFITQDNRLGGLNVMITNRSTELRAR